MGLLATPTSVPRALRLIPGLLGIVLALRALGLDLKMPAIPGLGGLGELFWLVLVLAPLAAFIVFRGARLFSPNKELEAGINRGVGQRSLSHGPSLLEVKFSGRSVRDGVLLKLLSLIRIRSGRTGSRYALILTSSKGVERLFVSIEGGDEEKDLFRALASSISEDLKIAEVGESAISMAAHLDETTRAMQPLEGEIPTRLGTEGLASSGGGGAPGSGRSLYLGRTVYPEEGALLFLYERDLAGHVGVFGSTGTGKSTTLFTIACRAWSDMGLSSVLLDWTGEHSEHIARGLRDPTARIKLLDPVRGDASLNPLLLGGESERVDVVVEILSKALDLSEPQSFMLRRVIEDDSPSTLGELEAYVEALPEESRWDREVKRALLRKVGILTRGSARRAFSALDSSLLSDAGDQVFRIVRLDNIKSLAARRAYVLTLLATMFFRAQEGGAAGVDLVAIDEADNVITLNGSKMGLLELLVSESRKYGLYVALATQSPSLVPNPIILNTNTKIVHALRSYRDKSAVVETMSLPPGFQERIDKLSVGTAVFQSVSLPEPVIVKVEKYRPVGDDAC